MRLKADKDYMNKFIKELIYSKNPYGEILHKDILRFPERDVPEALTRKVLVEKTSKTSQWLLDNMYGDMRLKNYQDDMIMALSMAMTSISIPAKYFENESLNKVQE